MNYSKYNLSKKKDKKNQPKIKNKTYILVILVIKNTKF